MTLVTPDTKCVCGHRFDVHAPDVNYPDSQRCFHGAATGDGCAEKYDDRCRDFREGK